MKPYYYTLRYNFKTGTPIENYYVEKLNLDRTDFYFNYGTTHSKSNTLYSKTFIDNYSYFIMSNYINSFDYGR